MSQDNTGDDFSAKRHATLPLTGSYSSNATPTPPFPRDLHPANRTSSIHLRRGGRDRAAERLRKPLGWRVAEYLTNTRLEPIAAVHSASEGDRVDHTVIGSYDGGRVGREYEVMTPRDMNYPRELLVSDREGEKVIYRVDSESEWEDEDEDGDVVRDWKGGRYVYRDGEYVKIREKEREKRGWKFSLFGIGKRKGGNKGEKRMSRGPGDRREGYFFDGRFFASKAERDDYAIRVQLGWTMTGKGYDYGRDDERRYGRNGYGQETLEERYAANFVDIEPGGWRGRTLRPGRGLLSELSHEHHSGAMIEDRMPGGRS